MVFPTHNSDNYEDKNGNNWTIGAGGTLTIQPGGYILEPTQDNIVANPGGGQANAVPLNGIQCRVTTVATTGDSLLLPPSQPGVTVVVLNSATNAAQMFGTGTDTVNGAAAATGSPLTGGKRASYTCYTQGAWFSN